eukprot:TRINITY_DN12240_c0_g2_i1.p2 TRINITY_DN12240_c0_g2~~TRINITY_DN12240_c0_g2_i1.p2  ORF type:complete len:166 (+),score=31.29 TRINITY_DN12240_c0_g2_i1:104-601(+)
MQMRRSRARASRGSLLFALMLSWAARGGAERRDAALNTAHVDVDEASAAGTSDAAAEVEEQVSKSRVLEASEGLGSRGGARQEESVNMMFDKASTITQDRGDVDKILQKVKPREDGKYPTARLALAIAKTREGEDVMNVHQTLKEYGSFMTKEQFREYMEQKRSS